MNINSNTKTICLLGHPVKHSFSPTIHNYLFKKYFENNIYVCFDVKEDKLKDCVYGIKALDIKGCNVTIPIPSVLYPFNIPPLFFIVFTAPINFALL